MAKYMYIRIQYLFAIVTIAFILSIPAILLSYQAPKDLITQYIVDISKDISSSISMPEDYRTADSNGEVKLKLYLSPWGELKDVYISESSGNKELDNLCLKAVRLNERYQPFPEEMGDSDLWLDVPLIFSKEISESYKTDTLYPKDEKIIAGNIVEAVDIALENHMPAKIAEEEIELSSIKVREARRSLFPAASLNYLETTGKTASTTQDFMDKEYKLKFEYPLYYGWRLKYAVEQAMSNMKVSAYNYDKVLQDLRLEVEVAYYAYLAAVSGLKLQKELLNEVENIFDIAKKRYDAGLITKSEFLQVDSQFKQVSYQVVSSENELDMAKLALTQAMNVDDIESTIGIDKDLESLNMFKPVELGVTLEQCVDMAFVNRPDLRAKEYTVDVNEYERKIVDSKNQLKVDLTGTYGRSGGAYETEPLIMGSDWYMGIKISKPLGGNTLSTSYTKDQTSEKHGQSSRTESSARAVELGILDNLQSFSEKKSSNIALNKAKEELNQTEEAVFKEVKEAYLNYKKGLVQTMANLQKIGYREEELKVAKVRAELNEMPLSELMRAYMNLTDEKTYYIEAFGSLYQALAKLNKATGYVLFLDDEKFELAGTK